MNAWETIVSSGMQVIATAFLAAYARKRFNELDGLFDAINDRFDGLAKRLDAAANRRCR